MSIVVDNHEDEEDENSGHKIHQHLQHQDQDVESGQSFFFIFVPLILVIFWWHEIMEFYIEPDFHYGDSDGDEGEQYRESSVCYQFLQVGDINGQNIRKTVVTLQPELEICLQ